MNKNIEQIRRKMESAPDVYQFMDEARQLFDERSVGQKIKDYFKEAGYSSGDVFLNGGLDRSYGYDILSSRTKKPGRDKLIMLAVGMRLDLDATQEFLEFVGTSKLDITGRRDSMIAYGILHDQSVRDINEALYSENMMELK